MQYRDAEAKAAYERIVLEQEPSKWLPTAYWQAAYTYGGTFADLCEKRMRETGRPLAEVAEAASFDADFPGSGAITILMFCTAMMVLVELWAHGDALRDWHNCRWAEAGVLCATHNGLLLPCFPITEVGQASVTATYCDFRAGVHLLEEIVEQTNARMNKKTKTA